MGRGVMWLWIAAFAVFAVVAFFACIALAWFLYALGVPGDPEGGPWP